MKEIITLAAMGSVILALSGCTATNTIAKGISEKSISASGTFLYNRTGLDTKTQTPEMQNLFIWGDYNSIAGGDEVFRYEENEDASIFNSSAVTKKKKVFFASGDKKRMDAVINAITKETVK